MLHKNLNKYKIRGRFTILQFMAILGGSALLITFILRYIFF
jgi:hypothetical protein